MCGFRKWGSKEKDISGEVGMATVESKLSFVAGRWAVIGSPGRAWLFSSQPAGAPTDGLNKGLCVH